LILPAILPTLSRRNTFIVASRAEEATATRLLNVIALSLLVSLPPEQLRLVLVDPEGAGENLGVLRGLDREIRGEVLREPRAIEEALEQITGEIQRVSELREAAGAATFDDYNARAEKKERYQLLVVV